VSKATDQDIELSRAVLQLLAAWDVPPDQQPGLLGLDPVADRRAFTRCRFGAPLPASGDVYARARLLLEIDTAVNQMFPHSSVAADLWATTPRHRFGGITPLQIMLEDGVAGMELVIDSLTGQSPL